MARVKSQSSNFSPLYTVDLLKGEGIPIPARPGGIAMACLIVVIPLLLGLGFTSFYMDGRVVISIEKDQLHKLEAASGALAGALAKKESLERDKTHAANVLTDIKGSLGGYTQWSQILEAVVANLSDTLVLTRVEAKKDIVRRKVAAKDNPAEKVDASMPVRTLKVSVCGRQAGNALEAVQKLQEDLRAAPAIGPLLDTITVSQSATVLDSQEAVMYELECVFKPGPIIQSN